MTHCRFNNTLEDLQDCYGAIDEPCSKAEHRKRKALVVLCVLIAADYGGYAGDLPFDEP